MAAPSSNDGSLGKKDRREAARERARLEREAEKRRQRRNRVFLQGGIGVVVLAIAAVIVLVVVNSSNPAAAPKASAVGPSNMATNGILFTGKSGDIVPTKTGPAGKKTSPLSPHTTYDDGVAHIVTYIDWACPVCKSFEQAYGDQLSSMVKSGAATLEVHPVAITDRSYGTSMYSTRANNAAACIANYDPKKFLDAQTVFYDNQPAELSSGLTNAQIKALVKQAGIDDPKVATCIDNESYKKWITSITARTEATPSLIQAGASGFGTPTVLVDGQIWPLSADFPTFLDSAVAAANK